MTADGISWYRKKSFLCLALPQLHYLKAQTVVFFFSFLFTVRFDQSQWKQQSSAVVLDISSLFF